jgi:hypothetical protein
MKDFTREELESGRPEKTPGEVIEYCLDKLFEDQEHSFQDEVSLHLTYEELIGALLCARDAVEELEEVE